jgi:ligand-binding sensor domain-containing protein
MMARKVGTNSVPGRIVSRLLLVAVGLAASLYALALLRPHVDPITPKSDVVFLSSRYITSIAVAPDGTIWAGSYGGLLRRTPDGVWRRFTRADGLPSNEVRRVSLSDMQLTATTPLGSAVFDHDRWRADPQHNVSAGVQPSGQLCAATWRGQEYAATAVGLQVREGNRWRDVPLPPSTGTHISALLPRNDALWAALYGDGIWAYDGHAWHPAALAAPSEAREITALAVAGGQGTLWIGTRRAGLWEYHDGSWRQNLMPDEPANHNCQSILAYHEELYVSTLEDGLAVRGAEGWKQFLPPTISSNAPRQMAVFGGNLYVRHGNGKVDLFTDGVWERDICHGLPRKEVSTIAADANRLYAAQWGGWSEFDGKTWTHQLQLPELQGVPVTVLYPDGDRLWIGTQGRGLAEYDRKSGKLRWHDERNGLSDDWITAIARAGKDLYVGTFVGGLARYEGTVWRTLPELSGENVTALANRGSDEMIVTTRHGVWHLTGNGVISPLRSAAIPLDPETQTLCVVPGGLWIGARTGLFFLANSH